MQRIPTKKYFMISALLHFKLLLILCASLKLAAPMAVVENTNKHDVISAVVLGDTAKSKILPQKIATKPPEPPKVMPAPPKPPVAVQKPKVLEKAIALKPVPKKKLADLVAHDLLADLDREKKKLAKNKIQKRKQSDAELQKKIRELAEKSMRRNLLNEDLKIKSTQSRESQGIINKYQALILQAISEHWVIPPSINKKFYSVLTIRLAPGGMVLDVQITKSSGDPALDRSAKAAVLKASPLPVPKELAEFEPFREFTMKVKPENIQDDTLTG